MIMKDSISAKNLKAELESYILPLEKILDSPYKEEKIFADLPHQPPSTLNSMMKIY